MIFEMTLVLLGISVAGFGLAGYLDLKTTEFPDWLPYSMIILALATRGIFAFLIGDYSLIIGSILIGGAFLLFGLTLYWLKQWGDGDAWLLGVLGFLWPDSGAFALTGVMPFFITMLFNFFLLSFIYLLIYSIALGLMNRKEASKFWTELNVNRCQILKPTVGFTIAILVLMGVMVYYFGMSFASIMVFLLFPVLLLSVLVFARYGRFVEANLFKKRIPAKDVRVGDVLASDKWRGLTEEEVENIHKKGGKIWIKEGVRFAPVFLITVLVTLFIGNLLLIFIV